MANAGHTVRYTCCFSLTHFLFYSILVALIVTPVLSSLDDLVFSLKSWSSFFLFGGNFKIQDLSWVRHSGIGCESELRACSERPALLACSL